LFTKLSIKLLIILVFIFLFRGNIKAQDTIIKKDTIKFSVDTLNFKKKTSSDALKSKVEYTCTDSMIFDIKQQKVYLYRDAEIKYENITLTAAYVEIDFKKNTVFAKGLLDSVGKDYGSPVFTEGEQKFRSKDMLYNYKTKKGLIKEVITQEGEGYLHGTTIKKMPNDEILIKSGLYTTCDLDHPHYQIQFKKGKVIPNDKIIIGPAELIIADVPTPIVIPFGFFPNKKGRASGIIFPQYGESTQNGFFLQDGGYYFGISDMVDTKILGKIYSKGTWGLTNITRYKKIYKYEGNFKLEFINDVTGDEGVDGYSKVYTYNLTWIHAQDPKSRPNSNFSANVAAGSSKFDKKSLTSSTTAYLKNDRQSAIKYSTMFNEQYPLNVDFSLDQNVVTHQLNFLLPQVAFSTPTYYPFRSKNSIGKTKWYENIKVGSYVLNFQNSLATYDTIQLNSINFKQFRNGMSHSIPVSYSLKILKYFNLTNTFNYTENWNLQTIEKNWMVDSITQLGKVKTDTIYGFKAARSFGYSSNLTTKLYGLYQFKNSYIKAIRHVVTPSIGFSYHPDFSAQKWGYYKNYIDGYDKNDNAIISNYSIFENGIYSYPPANKYGSINIGVSNNLEMKVRSKKDTINGVKKIVLIDNLYFGSSYDLAKDSLNWSPFSISGRTKLFKVIDVNYSSYWNPYVMDTSGIRYNRFEYTTNHRLFRHNSTAWAFNISYNLSPTTFKKKNADNKTPDNYNVPWNMSISYMLNSNDTYLKPTFKKKNTILQTLSFSGDLSLTPKWKIGATSGYDFVGKKISYTTVSINRDLHCWEMFMTWIPFGERQSYMLTIRVKASMLQDLKLEKKSDNSSVY